MTTSALLLALTNCNNEINYLTSQQLYWTNKYDANTERLNRLQKYETSWNEAYNKGMDAESDLSVGGTRYVKKDDINNETASTNYANAKVTQFVGRQDELNELEDLDIEYDAMKTMIEAQLEEKKSEKDSLEEELKNEAGDTHLLK